MNYKNIFAVLGALVLALSIYAVLWYIALVMDRDLMFIAWVHVACFIVGWGAWGFMYLLSIRTRKVWEL